MVLVSDVLKHIVRIYSPLNLANIKIKKIKFVRNTAPDNQRVLNFMRNPELAHILVMIARTSQITQTASHYQTGTQHNRLQRLQLLCSLLSAFRSDLQLSYLVLMSVMYIDDLRNA